MAKLNSNKQSIGFTLHNLTYNDLKRECISRSMPFEKVVTGDFPTLNNWLNHNISKPKNKELIVEYDDWLDNILLSRNKPELVHTSLRLSYLSDKPIEKTEDGEPKPMKEKVIRVKKKREKNEEGIFGGTKKALVWEMVAKGRSLEKTIIRVMKRFPDAKEKSIKIWYNKRKREIGK